MDSHRVPSSSLTIDAFACTAIVEDGSTPSQQIPVVQSAIALTVPNSATVWLAIVNTDTGAAPAGWTRESNKRTHYVYQATGTKPANPTSGLVFSKVTVSGGVITAVQNFAFRSAQDAARREHDVRSWGATGDGTTDDTTAVQNAVNALIENGDVVRFSRTENYYRLTSTVTIPTTRGIVITGDGWFSSQVQQETSGQDVFATQNTTTQNNVIFRDLWINGNSKTARYGIVWGTTTAGLNRSAILNCRVDSFATAAILFQNSILVNVQNCIITGNVDGIANGNVSVSGPNGYNISGCQFETNTGFGINVGSVRGWTVTGCTIEANPGGGIKMDIPQGVFIGGNYLEGNFVTSGGDEYSDILLGDTSFANGVKLSGNFYAGLATYSEDYVPVRIKFSGGIHASGESVANGSRYMLFKSSASIIGLRVDEVAFVNGSFTESGADASFLGIPTSFHDITRRNFIQQLTHPNGQPRQANVRIGQVPLILDHFTTAVTGTGSIAVDGVGLLIASGTTASSTALARSYIGASRGVPRNNLNYNNSKEYTFMIEFSNLTANGEAWILITSGTTAADPSSAAFGFKVAGTALRGLSHSGASLADVDLSTTLAANQIYTLRALQTGSAIQWFFNGSQVGSSSTVPTTTSAVGNVLFATDNNADAAQHRFAVLDVHYSVTQ